MRGAACAVGESAVFVCTHLAVVDVDSCRRDEEQHRVYGRTKDMVDIAVSASSKATNSTQRRLRS